jgi:hypothetical protein
VRRAKLSRSTDGATRRRRPPKSEPRNYGASAPDSTHSSALLNWRCGKFAARKSKAAMGCGRAKRVVLRGLRAKARGELIAKDLVETQAAYLLVALSGPRGRREVLCVKDTVSSDADALTESLNPWPPMRRAKFHKRASRSTFELIRRETASPIRDGLPHPSLAQVSVLLVHSYSNHKTNRRVRADLQSFSGASLTRQRTCQGVSCCERNRSGAAVASLELLATATGTRVIPSHLFPILKVAHSTLTIEQLFHAVKITRRTIPEALLGS